jgi:hypothetical protein
MAGDKMKWYPYFRVQKYGAETFDRIQQHLGHAPSNEELADLEMRGLFVPDGVAAGQGNLMTDTGIKRLWACASGLSSAIQMTATATFMGVGTSSTAAAGTDTDLLGTKAYRQVNSGPAVATTTSTDDAIQFSVQFGSGAAEHAWNEWAIGTVLSGTASSTVQTSLASVGTTPVILNRAVSALGTKGAGSTWTLTAKITLN